MSLNAGTEASVSQIVALTERQRPIFGDVKGDDMKINKIYMVLI
jgi:hypothetical protein